MHLDVGNLMQQTPDDFLSALLSLSVETIPTLGAAAAHVTVNAKDGTETALMIGPMLTVPARWLGYVAVDDVYGATRRAAALGAMVLQSVTELGDIGWMSIIQAPMGGVITMWQTRAG